MKAIQFASRSVSGIVSISIAVCVLLVGTACRGTAEDPTQPLTDSSEHLRTARLISHVTDGMVSRETDITVRFVAFHDRRVSDEQRLADAFSVSQRIEGTAAWRDGRTLVFSPRGPLSAGKRYQCVLDVASVLPTEKSAKPFAFEFTVAPNRIVAWSLDLEPETEDNPEQMRATGHLEFSDPVDFAQIEEAVKLELGRTSVPLEWKSDGGNTKLWFSSGTLTRSSRVQQVKLTVPVEPFGIETRAERSVELRPLDDFAVVDFTLHDQERNPRISVQLSDPLPESKDISGYVRLEPEVDVRVSAVGNTLFVSGTFTRGQNYTLFVRHGLPSRWGAQLGGDYSHTFKIVDLKPQIAFTQTGAILPSRSNGTIGFRSVNLREVNVSVARVFESNLGQFLQEHDLESGKNRSRYWGNLRRVGVDVASKKLEIGETRNTSVQSTLDLSKLIADEPRGLYLVTLGFNRDQMLYECGESTHYPYWEHPCGHGYSQNHGTVAKAVVLTDIGLLAKREGDGLLVAANHLATTQPLSNVELTLYSFQNQPLESQTTNRNGTAKFKTAQAFYLEARWNDQRSALKFSESELSLSGFDVGGATGSAQATRAFVYADRGVFRPGDTIHLGAIVRNQDGSFPDGHPISLKVRNPRNQVVIEEVNRKGLAGHYGFEVPTSDSDPTGAWIADFYNGESLLTSFRIRVETVVPNRLKVRLDLPKPKIGPNEPSSQVSMTSSYLFGAPASGLRGTVNIRYHNIEKQFGSYPGFIFRHPTRRFTSPEDTLFDEPLSPEGKAVFEWSLPDFADVPSAISATLTARVFEKGGRPTTTALRVPIDVYDAYVGVQQPDARWVRSNQPLPITAVLLNNEGTPIPDRDLQVSLFHNDRYWWWEYESYDDFKMRFKTDIGTELIDTQTVKSGSQPVAVELDPDRRGQILVEVRDPVGGHASGFFIWVSSWGSQQAPLDAGSQLELEVDRERFLPGETAHITAATPSEGMLFVSVEKGNRVLSHRWVRLQAENTTIDLPVTREMMPNVYVHVMALQPHSQTINDRPIRLYGVVPISVEESSTRLAVELRAPKELRPREEFEVEIQVPRNRPSTVSVAVVDEGLLDLTSFKTPDPWGFFFAKERLSVSTFDLYDDVIGALWGEVQQRFFIGGDEDSYRRDQTSPVKARRFPPVSMFSGPVKTDSNGRARISFTMPHYMGSVRVMAVATSGLSYGHADSTVPVRDPIILLPSLPRVAGPGEHFSVPVSVFCLEEGLGAVDVAISSTAPLSVKGTASATVECENGRERELMFELSSAAAAGVSTVRFTAKSKKFNTWNETELAVRPVNPRIYDAKELKIDPKGTSSFLIPELGLEGTRSAKVRISPLPGITFGHRLQTLIRYPYGCMEQTMSAVFPQLKLKDLLKENHSGKDWNLAIERNINAGIKRLRRFQTPDGGFAYWPGGAQSNLWSTNYGGHFLIEARRAGFYVPDSLLNPWVRFQKRAAAREQGDGRTLSYRLFLLALVGESEVGAMNLLREERLSRLDNASRWFLAAAYQVAGMNEAAQQVLVNAGTDIISYRERGGSFGSTLRDRSILLYLATFLNRDQTAFNLYGEINAALTGRHYLSTQEGAFALLAVGTYLGSTWDKEAQVQGRVVLENRDGDLEFSSGSEVSAFELTENIGTTVKVVSDSDAPLYAVFEWEGIPLEGPTEAERNNLNLTVKWYDESGHPVDPARLPQGTIFWCHLNVGSRTGNHVENMALMQIFPSGWEIDATRLRGEAVPDWARRFNLGRETYLDVRDDRAMWFFDLQGRQQADFLVKLLAVTAGEYTLSPTYAEAMYDHAYRAIEPGGPVQVVEPE